MNNTFVNKFNHKQCVFTFTVFGVLFLINSIISMVYAFKIRSFLKFDIAKLFTDYTSMINLYPTGITMFFLIVLLLLFTFFVAFYMAKLIKEDKLLIFKNLHFSLACILLFFIFIIDFVINPINTLFLIFMDILLFLISAFFVAINVIALLKNKIIIFSTLNELINEFKTIKNKTTDNVEEVKVAEEENN